MAHEIMENDGLVLHKTGAWHGLGTVVADAPTPAEALKLAKLDWEVATYPLIAAKTPTDGIRIKTHVGNYRTDTDGLLGIVGKGYKPFQNAELADFCMALAEQEDQVKVESAGSIRNGQKVWFLLKGESFSIRKEDEVAPYYCISNGHDGWTALRCTPTTVRVVCSNTLHMVIPSHDKADQGSLKVGMKSACFVCKHTGKLKDKVEEAKAALGLYGKALTGTKEVLTTLAAKEATTELLQKFWTSCFAHDFDGIPTNPKTAADQNKLWKAQQAIRSMTVRFEREQSLAGSTMWNAFNAYTGWLQNDNNSMAKDANAAAERRMSSKLFGQDAKRAHNALRAALSLAT